MKVTGSAMADSTKGEPTGSGRGPAVRWLDSEAIACSRLVVSPLHYSRNYLTNATTSKSETF